MNESITPLLSRASTKNQANPSSFLMNLDNAVRRLFDVTLALMGLFLLSPIFVLIAVLIKRDSVGPVFYWGKRVGKGQRPFHILKFRTMAETQASYNGPRVTGKGDSRITPIGQWLRDTKINELPQLWNVLKGDMSFVGPRPEDETFVKHWPEDAQLKLLSIRPGITSPASVLYRDEENLLQTGNVVDDYLKHILPSKLRLDLIYVRHRSFLTDLDVIFWTLLALLPQLKSKTVPEHMLFWGPLSRFINRYFSWFILDSLSAFVAVAITGVIWRTTGPLELGIQASIGVALSIAIIFSLMNALLGVGRVVWSTAGVGDALTVAFSTGLATFVLLLANHFWHPRTQYIPYWGTRLLPSGMLIIVGLFSLAGFVGMRYRMRIVTGLSAHWMSIRGSEGIVGERVLIVGAGKMGEMAIYLLQKSGLAQAFSIVGMIDDDPRKQGSRIHGHQVLGDTADISQLVRTHDVGLIMFAIENITPAEKERILEQCDCKSTRTIVMPNVLASFESQLTYFSERAQVNGRSNHYPSHDVTHLNGQQPEWLTELDFLIQTQSWDAAHDMLEQIQETMENVV